VTAPRAVPGYHAGTPWHTVPPAEVVRLLETGGLGLSVDAASARLARQGPNEIEAERETPLWEIVVRQVRDPLIYILVVAGGVSLALRDFTDAALIAIVVVINTIIGVVQEYRAQQAIHSLARMTAPRATVLRDGAARDIESREVVPGDVLLLTSGARVSADARLRRTRRASDCRWMKSSGW
jgi:Ca2+-transporting ATPase